jgi:hypothetical protein
MDNATEHATITVATKMVGTVKEVRIQAMETQMNYLQTLCADRGAHRVPLATDFVTKHVGWKVASLMEVIVNVRKVVDT